MCDQLILALTQTFGLINDYRSLYLVADFSELLG